MLSSVALGSWESNRSRAAKAGDASYGLSFTADGLSLLERWVGPEEAVLFATEGAGFDEYDSTPAVHQQSCCVR